MLVLYFSGTGNTEYIAQMFSRQMDAKCLSIEDEVNFTQEIKAHDCIAFCYPIYGSRVPRNMREFVFRHMSDINGKKIVILVTQVIFSGDGARVLTDLFWDGMVEVIYAEHFLMPCNVNNMIIFRKPSKKAIEKYLRKAEKRMQRVCNDIKQGIIKKRGFSRLSQILGSVQGSFWQGDSREVEPKASSLEYKSKNAVKISKECNACNLCIDTCPVKNFTQEQGIITPKGNCAACYRCINHCPKRAIKIVFKSKPKWQYEGVTS